MASSLSVETVSTPTQESSWPASGGGVTVAVAPIGFTSCSRGEGSMGQSLTNTEWWASLAGRDTSIPHDGASRPTSNHSSFTEKGITPEICMLVREHAQTRNELTALANVAVLRHPSGSSDLELAWAELVKVRHQVTPAVLQTSRNLSPFISKKN
eukprot:CAMPEP_0177777170 /NCGR_PEP_ID=MMETSP0491_2-20121128/15169_1 /TAXON_ID=63592 /ORGANISM="Tetraselmis chuii, Strain PLY429" /LENGTH=154 /DNA_ID=CAMNT_0019296141 /DNA_START=131 /DNA_END=595 /DNA_ORIENTATION=-